MHWFIFFYSVSNTISWLVIYSYLLTVCRWQILHTNIVVGIMLACVCWRNDKKLYVQALTVWDGQVLHAVIVWFLDNMHIMSVIIKVSNKQAWWASRIADSRIDSWLGVKIHTVIAFPSNPLWRATSSASHCDGYKQSPSRKKSCVFQLNSFLLQICITRFIKIQCKHSFYGGGIKDAMSNHKIKLINSSKKV